MATHNDIESLREIIFIINVYTEHIIYDMVVHVYTSVVILFYLVHCLQAIKLLKSSESLVLTVRVEEVRKLAWEV